ncbi:molecular chaperone DnaK (HSP70) [Sinobacterium caligoides]|uniref:Molecular chaperone DnaK (HSP70) n=1 Tax=Sinobacterium caligoides TaxID=933926 RepID=A0A3N2DNE9_9GAMM|nr:Hsp70 family protein [Sinobacterium caligoides]ROS01212.1 molecular chaperone DnaK (HSP70) [Sinobacterium caligoides]
MSRYTVGIDLGTTNTALAYVDNAADDKRVQPFAITQVVASGSVEARKTLPSTAYISAGTELVAGALNLPWRSEDKVVLGAFARDQGAKVPTRFIHSAKSWFGHNSIDPESAILPANSPEQDAKRAPTEVAKMLLTHLREAWNHEFASDDASADLIDQEVTLCVPASFDANARNLTVAAAEAVGFKNLHLLEEPQAAIYSWIEALGDGWRKELKKGDLVLVVDVGGGTSDFSLVAITEEAGELQLRRVAVGEHILLGGDNMDLALAYGVAQRLKQEKSKKLDDWQMAALVQQCRKAKEVMLADSSIASQQLTILGRGSSVIGGALKIELQRETLQQVLLEGFFPEISADEMPARPRRRGFREQGLPYASDAGITRHLAKFLNQHADAVTELLPELTPEPGQPVLPTAVLFNGGVFNADVLRDRVMETLYSWAEDVGAQEPRALEQGKLDLAVAHGAAYLGLARAGEGIRIRGGSARSYYIGIESAEPAVPGFEPPMHAMCVVPHGMEEGTSIDISGAEAGLCIYTGEPGEFQFYSSTVRTGDKPGELIEFDEGELIEHNPVETALGERKGEVAEIDLRSNFTDIGVLQLLCVNANTQETYDLEFNVRHHDDEG